MIVEAIMVRRRADDSTTAQEVLVCPWVADGEWIAIHHLV